MLSKNVIYVNQEQLSQLLKDPLFIAYAPITGSGGKTSGGCFPKSDTFFQLKKAVVAK